MKDIIHYIIRFLIGEEISDEIVQAVGYTSDRNLYQHYKLVIVPSSFFNESVYGTPASMPKLPLQEIENVPLLFGSNKVEWVGNTWVVHADVIASTFFLITRYEEIIRKDVRDEHGRFPGKESLLYRAGCIHRPIVDKYRILLRRWLRQVHLQVPEIENQIQKVWLTHDVDSPFYCRTLRNVIRETVKGAGLIQAGKWYLGSLEKDPYYTFPWMFEQTEQLKKVIGDQRCHSLLFFKAGGKSTQDRPVYSLRSKDLKRLLALCRDQKALIGLHSSYSAGKNPELIQTEKDLLEKQLGVTITYNRHHYLACREPRDVEELEKSGITDDFTMGYADVSGFRLGTCYPVRWINPETFRLTQLTLHPLIIMDCTLNEPKYMGLSYDKAEALCTRLLEEVKKVGGEIVLLWHNTSFQKNIQESYHCKLYLYLLNKLTKR